VYRSRRRLPTPRIVRTRADTASPIRMLARVSRMAVR
jgi:hypothetical protein